MNQQTKSISNPHLARWVDEMAKLCKPDRVVWCDGSEAEAKRLTDECLKTGVLHPVNQEQLPGCYLHRSDPNDVARVEHVTFICTPSKEEAGPTNNWMAPDDAYRKLGALYDGAMKGRTMYVVPYIMGPAGAPSAKIGVELTDSIYVVLNMGLMTRMGQIALDALGQSNEFNRGLHSLGDLSPERRFICHFPQDNTIWSIGSGYGGNVLLGKKCLALRIGSYLGRNEGWMAEHMLIIGAQSPEGETTYVAGAFPSQCGKTNFAMMIPPTNFKGWKIWTVGDDIAWMRVGPDGRLWAINPEAGYFGVVPGTNFETNPNAMRSIARDTIYTNVAQTKDGGLWWEGKDGPPPAEATDWRGRPWTPASGEKAAHPNSRFTAPMRNNPALSPEANAPQGVPISAILFGGRRSNTVPLVMQSFDWNHGVYLGAMLASETTAAATGAVGVVRRDPMAMLPFCGYDMGKYFQHWLDMRQKLTHPPQLFMVNWFRKGTDGKFLWPGYTENMRALKWMIERVQGRAGARQTLAGYVPRPEDLDLGGLKLERAKLEQALAVEQEEWRAEADLQEDLFKLLAATMPQELKNQRARLRERIAQSAAGAHAQEGAATL